MKNIIIKLIVVICLIVGNNSTTFSQPLDSLLELAVKQNPTLKALDLQYRSELTKLDQVGQFQNPQLGIGVPILRPETRLGPQLLSVSASQLFPWFGSSDDKKDVVISMSKVNYEKIAALKLNLFYTIKSNYYQLIYFTEQERYLKQELQLLIILEKLGLSKVENGQGSIADVLRIQLQKDELSNQLAQIENLKRNSVAQINEVSNQSWAISIRPIDTIQPTLILHYNLDSFQQKINAHHPLIEMLNAEMEVSENRIAVNQSMNSPMVGFGIDYTLVGERTDANPINNGRDILVPKVMLSIPLYRKSYTSMNEMERLNQESISLKKESEVDQMIRQIIQFKIDYDNAILDQEFFEKQVRTANQTYEILLTSYSTNSSRFEELLVIQGQLFRYQMNLIRSKLQANLAVLKIERITNF